MEWVSIINKTHDRIKGLLQVISGLKAENHQLTEENALLKDEAARLKEQLGGARAESAQYLTERDSIKERVERLIQFFD